MENTLENAQTFYESARDEWMEGQSIHFDHPRCLVAYAASTRPDVVLPSEDQAGCIALDLVPDLKENEQAFFVAGFQTCIRYLNNNPDLNFIEQVPHGLESVLPSPCPNCGGKMLIVRPGSWQCEECGY